jgi:hypothetical protein
MNFCPGPDTGHTPRQLPEEKAWVHTADSVMHTPPGLAAVVAISIALAPEPEMVW